MSRLEGLERAVADFARKHDAQWRRTKTEDHAFEGIVVRRQGRPVRLLVAVCLNECFCVTWEHGLIGDGQPCKRGPCNVGVLSDEQLAAELVHGVLMHHE